MRCVFCELPEIQERIIVKNDFAWAFPTNIPIVPGHTLIAPIRCVEKIDDLTEDELRCILNIMILLKPALQNTFAATGFNFSWNEGEVAGQEIPHLHLHMLPRKEKDAGIYQYDPRKFLYRPGSRQPSPEKELQDVAASIRKSLS